MAGIFRSECKRGSKLRQTSEPCGSVFFMLASTKLVVIRFSHLAPLHIARNACRRFAESGHREEDRPSELCATVLRCKAEVGKDFHCAVGIEAYP